MNSKIEMEETKTTPEAATEAPKATKATAAQKQQDIKEAKKDSELAEVEALRKQLEEMKAGQKDFEDKTLAAALAKVGISVHDFLAAEKAKKSDKDVIEVDIGRQVVHINGIPYSGTIRGERGFIEGIASAAGNAREQRFRELVGKQYQVEMLNSGGIKTKLVKQFEDVVEA